MPVSRRDLLKAALASAVLGPVNAMAAGSQIERVEYTGADDPAAYRRFLDEQSRNAVVFSVFHAKWCGPCKALFKQLDEIAQQPGVKIKVVGVDVGPPAYMTGPYKNIVQANNAFATPSVEILAAGDTQYSMKGFIQNVPEMTRYLRELTTAVHGDVSTRPASGLKP